MPKKQEELKAELGQAGWEDCGIWLAKCKYEGRETFVVAYWRLWRNRTNGRMICEVIPEGQVIPKEPSGLLTEVALDHPPMETNETLKALAGLLGWGRFLI